MTDKPTIYIPAHVQLLEPIDFHGMRYIRYTGEWHPHPYKAPLLVRIAIAFSIASVIMNLANLIWSYWIWPD